MQDQVYKAIFFDLDGTLLNLDMDSFLEEYFGGIGSFVAKRGYEPKLFIKAIGAGVHSMINEQGCYNIDRFWNAFVALTGLSQEEIEPLLLEYYETDFNAIGRNIVPREESRIILQTLKEKGYPLYLTTMPLFPRIAVEKRLAWAGCSPDYFERITTYDNSTSAKPHVSYYQENIDLCGFAPGEVLMVGNNTKEDLACLEIGMDAYLVTDYILDPIQFDLETVKHGTLKEFLSFVENLPECE